MTTCPRCSRTLAPYTFNGIGYRYCLPVTGGCGYGRRETADLFDLAGIVVPRQPRDLFDLMGVAL